MRTGPELTRLQQRVLALSRNHGSRTVVALITVGSLITSVTATSASFLVGTPPSPHTMVVSLVVAVIVPLVVAPLASTTIVQLLWALAVAHDDLHVLATTDALTGAANRRRFYEEAAELLADPGDGNIVLAGMVDIDRFKDLNDRFGHAVGDVALAELAARLRHAAGSLGVVGRVGGDEFAVFLTLPEASLAVVTHALTAACAPVEVQPGWSMSASLGLRTIDGDHVTADEAMRLADEALYAAKAARSRSEPVPGVRA